MLRPIINDSTNDKRLGGKSEAFAGFCLLNITGSTTTKKKTQKVVISDDSIKPHF